MLKINNYYQSIERSVTHGFKLCVTIHRISRYKSHFLHHRNIPRNLIAFHKYRPLPCSLFPRLIVNLAPSLSRRY